MPTIIKESDIPNIRPIEYERGYLVHPGERLNGVTVWTVVVLPKSYGEHAIPKVEPERVFFIEVEDPDNEATQDRIRTALNAQSLAKK